MPTEFTLTMNWVLSGITFDDKAQYLVGNRYLVSQHHSIPTGYSGDTALQVLDHERKCVWDIPYGNRKPNIVQNICGKTSLEWYEHYCSTVIKSEKIGTYDDACKLASCSHFRQLVEEFTSGTVPK